MNGPIAIALPKRGALFLSLALGNLSASFLAGCSSGSSSPETEPPLTPLIERTTAAHCTAEWFTETEFNNLFSQRNPVYSWDAWEQALRAAPEVICSSAGGDHAKQKMELAALFAHIRREVGDLAYVEEICGTEGTCLNSYNTDWSGNLYPPQPGQSYHGRGAIQLSWPGNYGSASNFLLGDKMELLLRPERVSEEGSLAFATAFWFWAHNPQNGQKCSSVFWNTGFGATTQVINGTYECGARYGGIARQREALYDRLLNRWGVNDERSRSEGCAPPATDEEESGDESNSL